MSILYARNVPPELLHAIRVAAVQNKRTTSEEVVLRLTRSLQTPPVDYQPTPDEETDP